MSRAKSRPTWRSNFLSIPFLGGVLATATLLVAMLVVVNWDSTSRGKSNPNLVRENPREPNATIENEPSIPKRVDNYLRGDGDLPELVDTRTHFERSIALDKLLNQSSFDDALALLSRSNQIARPQLRLSTQTEIFRKLATIDPKQAILLTQSFHGVHWQHFTSTIFREWYLADSDAALSFAEEFVRELEPEQRRGTLVALLDASHDLSEYAKRDIASRLGLEDDSITLFDSEANVELPADPKGTWDNFLTDNEDNLGQVKGFVELALKIVERDGLEAFAELYDTLPQRRVRIAVMREVLYGRLEDGDPGSVFELAVKLHENANRSVIFDVANRWATTDPVGTLDAIAQIEDSELKEDLANEIALYWTSTDPRSALEHSAVIPENLRAKARRKSITILAEQQPSEAAKYIVGIDADHIETVAAHVLDGWVRQDVVSAFNWLIGEIDIDPYRSDLFNFGVAGRIDADNAERLVHIALEHPVGETGVGYEGRVVGLLSKSDVERAKSLVPLVREGQTQTVAQAVIGSRALFSEDDPIAAFELVDQLPIAQRPEFEGLVVAIWATREPSRAFEYVDQLSSPVAKSRASLWLSALNRTSATYSETQLEKLNSLMTDRELRELETENLWEVVSSLL